MINQYYNVCNVNKALIEFIKQDISNVMGNFIYSKLVIETSNCILNNSKISDSLKKQEENISKYFFNDIQDKYYNYGLSNVLIKSNYNNKKEIIQNFTFQFLLTNNSVRLDFSIKNNNINLDFIVFSGKTGFFATFNHELSVFFLGLKNIEQEMNIMNERVIIKTHDFNYTSKESEKYLKSAEDFIKCLQLINQISKNNIYSNFKENYLNDFFSSILYKKEKSIHYKDINDLILLNSDVNLYSLNSLIDFNVDEKIYLK